MKRSKICLLLALLTIGAPSLAAASHYPLDQVYVLISRAQAKKLRRAGVRTTADFLVWGRTGEGRNLLAGRAGLPVEQVTAWVFLSDLMQVRGIGPDVARLLTAVGVRTLADLQRADANVTAVSVRDVNKRTHLSTNPPGAESIRYWVQQSQGMPIVIALD